MIRVSVIIPCYNRADLLSATLDSLCAQTYSHWEGIVVDDHSSDGSIEVVRRYACQDSRIRTVSRQGARKGASVCRNEALALAQGEYIVFLDSDDLLSPTCLEYRVQAMDRAPACGFGVYQTELFTRAIGDQRVLFNAHTDGDDLHRFLSLDNVWLTTSPIWRKQAVVRLGGFDEELPSFQDWAIHVRALITGIAYFKQPLRDNFHRHEYSGSATITKVLAIHPDHLLSHEILFTRILHDLKIARLLDNETHRRVAGLFWWLALRWRAASSLADAVRVWRRACDLGLCSRRHCLEGRLILKFRLYSFRGGGRIARLIQWSWPKQYYQFHSPYFKNAPMDLQNELVADRR